MSDKITYVKPVEHTRTKNSIRNSIVSMISTIVTMIISFIAQAIFIKILGTEYLGINGLFSNIVSMMSIIELGIGPAIIYNLYKPIAENDIQKVKSLLKLYKISYTIIAILIAIIGICILPFLPFIIGNVNIQYSIYLIFLLFIIDVIFSYFITYKRSILYASQEDYIITLVHLVYIIFMNIIQIIVLLTTKNYILYLLIKVIMRFFENIIITIIANKKYPYITEKKVDKLDKEIVNDIIKKVKALFLHKIGGVVVMSTDNILISSFVGISAVGLYSNYLIIINNILTLFSQMFTSITSSVGNLLVKEKKEKTFIVYKNIDFINFWLSTFSSCCIFCLIQPFIILWIGNDYLLSVGVVITIVLNYFMVSMRRSISVFKDAAGICYEDRFVPLLESLINLIASIVLLKLFGLIGVFLGTFISTLLLFMYSYPKYVYVKLFNRKHIEYILSFIKQLLGAIIICVITYSITLLNTLNNIYFSFALNIFICLLVPNIILVLVYYKSNEFKYFKILITNLISKFLVKK